MFSVTRPELHSFQNDTSVLKSGMEVQVAAGSAWEERVLSTVRMCPGDGVICALRHDGDVAGIGTRSKRVL